MSLSPQLQNTSSLIGTNEIQSGERFDPTQPETVRLNGQDTRLSLCGTASVPTSIGHHTVAFYANDGRPSIKPRETENQVHPEVDLGVLVGGGLLELLTPSPDEPGTLLGTGMAIDDFGPRL
jgi:hypothetical protein